MFAALQTTPKLLFIGSYFPVSRGYFFFPSRLAHMEPDDLDGLIHMSGASAELAELAESIWKARVSLLMVSYLPGA